MSMRAIASSEDGATIVGINKTKISMFTFGLGAVITGVTGILYAMIFSASYSMGFEFSSFAFIIVVVGGVGSFYGTIAASILVGLIQSYTAYFIGSRYRLIVMFGILMLILIWKPTGFQGREL
jgi:branched-chain amino acid transport system permease protein